uniref:A-kinase anchor protein 7-like phosphoesterase domain-containing protein n=1 Tax=Latimeria chalumnae TaxID=7897 RepID=H3B1J8_LATCH
RVNQESQGQVNQESKDEVSQAALKVGRQPPNYFVAIPVTNDQILDKVEDVQELIVTKEPELLRALIPVERLHLTIVVAHLRSSEEVEKAILALQHCKSKVDDLLQGNQLNMTFHGIGQFNNEVVYVKMIENEQQMLNKVAESVELCFREMGVNITGSKEFKPHLTFLKLSKAPALKRKGFRKICSDLYKEYEDCAFGTEAFMRIDLCSMHKKQQESGYYYCECSISVASSCGSKVSDTEL